MKTILRPLIPLVPLLVFLCGVPAAAKADEEHPAMTTVRSATEQILQRIEQNRESIKADPQFARQLMSELILPNFDFQNMSKWVLGKNWKLADKRQKDMFVEEFRNLLVRTYSAALSDYSGQEVEFLETRTTKRDDLVLVRTKLELGDSKSLDVGYRMLMREGSWKVIDVLIDGTSLTTTYRNSFATEIRKNGLDALLAKMREKNSLLDDE